jgi:hypothetical protein
MKQSVAEMSLSDALEDAPTEKNTATELTSNDLISDDSFSDEITHIDDEDEMDENLLDTPNVVAIPKRSIETIQSNLLTPSGFQRGE